jgi:excisionase family DNA binding protein
MRKVCNMAGKFDPDLMMSGLFPTLPGISHKEIVAAVKSRRAALAGQAGGAAPPVAGEPGKLLKMAEAAARLGLCRRTLYLMAGRGELRLVRVGRRSTRVPLAEVLRLAAGQATGQGGEQG